MPLWFAALLGLVQGLTEFLPISSTAHLRILPALLGREDAGAAFTAVIQLGTLAAVLVYFARDLGRMVRGMFVDRGGRDFRLALYLVAATVPIAILGVLLKPYIVGPLRSLYVVALALAGFALVLWWADRNAPQTRSVWELSLTSALLIGLAQALALVPGVSRSGATIACALVVGLRREDAARFSFLLSIPAILGAGLFELPDAIAHADGESLVPLIVATLVAAVSGYASIAWLLHYLRKRGLAAFVGYRVLLGAAILLLVLAGFLDPSR